MPPELEWILHLLPASTRFAATAGGTAVLAVASAVYLLKLSLCALRLVAEIPDAVVKAIGAWRGFPNRVKTALAPLEPVALAPEPEERRSGLDRRVRAERRRTVMAVVPERRSGIDRRQGERRRTDEPPALAVAS
jgi:hypothetical protein